MNDEFLKKANTIRDLWNKADEDDVIKRYEVATRWPDGKKFAAMANTTEDGVALSWTHWVELAKEDNDELRAHLTRLARKHGWCVPELRKHRLEASESDDGDDATGDEADRSDEKVDFNESDNATSTTGLLATVGGFTSAISDLAARKDQLEQAISKADASEIPDALQKVKAAQGSVKELSEGLDSCVVQLEERIKPESRKGKRSACLSEEDLGA